MFGLLQFRGKGKKSNVSLRAYANEVKGAIKEKIAKFKRTYWNAGTSFTSDGDRKNFEYGEKIGTKSEIKKGNYEIHVSAGRNALTRKTYDYDGIAKYENGKLVSQVFTIQDDINRGFVKLGKPVNKSKLVYTYYGNGKLKRYEEYNREGIICNALECSINGNLLNEVEYDECGEIKSLKKYKDGLLESISHYEYDGLTTKVASKTEYERNKNGEVTGAKVLDGDGNVAKSASLSYGFNGKAWKYWTSNVTEYYKDGRVKSDVQYYDNGKERTRISYDAQGIKTLEVLYAPDGKVKAKREHLDKGNQISTAGFTHN